MHCRDYATIHIIIIIIIIIIKLLQDEDPMEQSDSRQSTIATFNLDPFEVKIKFIYGIFFYQNIPITQKIFDFNNNTI
jgi:hypothetical protein